MTENQFLEFILPIINQPAIFENDDNVDNIVERLKEYTIIQRIFILQLRLIRRVRGDSDYIIQTYFVLSRLIARHPSTLDDWFEGLSEAQIIKILNTDITRDLAYYMPNFLVGLLERISKDNRQHLKILSHNLTQISLPSLQRILKLLPDPYVIKQLPCIFAYRSIIMVPTVVAQYSLELLLKTPKNDVTKEDLDQYVSHKEILKEAYTERHFYFQEEVREHVVGNKQSTSAFYYVISQHRNGKKSGPTNTLQWFEEQVSDQKTGSGLFSKRSGAVFPVNKGATELQEVVAKSSAPDNAV